MSVETSLAIIAISLVILIVGILLFLVVLSKVLKGTQHALNTLEIKLHPLIEQTSQTVQIASELSNKIKDNIELTKPLFNSIQKIGQATADCLTETSYEKPSHNPKFVYVSSQNSKQSKVQDWMDWIGLGILVLDKIKKRMEK